MRPGVEGGTPSGSGPGPAEAQPGSLAPRDDTAAGGTPPTAEGGRDRLGASSGRWEWMGGGEARWADERGSSPSGEGPKPEEALCGVPPTRGDIAAHRPPPAGGMECGAPEGGRGGPEDADTGMSSRCDPKGGTSVTARGGGRAEALAWAVPPGWWRMCTRRQLEGAAVRDRPPSSPNRRRPHALRAREAARCHQSHHPLHWWWTSA